MTNLTVETLRAIGTKLRENTVNNEYTIFIHPDIVQELRYMSARAKYKLESHKRRYMRRYGFYPLAREVEISQLENFLLFICKTSKVSP